MENYKLFGERVLVKQDSRKEKTESGLYLPESSDRTKPSTGEVMLVGNGKTVSSMLKVKDKVIFDLFSGIELEIDGNKYKVLGYNDILMTFGE